MKIRIRFEDNTEMLVDTEIISIIEPDPEDDGE